MADELSRLSLTIDDWTSARGNSEIPDAFNQTNRILADELPAISQGSKSFAMHSALKLRSIERAFNNKKIQSSRYWK